MILSYTLSIVDSTGVLRGLSVGSWIGSIEFPTTATGRQTSGSNSRAVTGCQAGDRLVLELGYVAENTSSTSFTGYINYGGTGATALADGSTAVTTNPGWMDFNDDTVADFWVAPPSASVEGDYFPFLAA
jgi:hypothetical protein